MGDLRINFIDNWEKKDVNLGELTHALEDGNSSVYTDASLKKVSAKWTFTLLKSWKMMAWHVHTMRIQLLTV